MAADAAAVKIVADLLVSFRTGIAAAAARGSQVRCISVSVRQRETSGSRIQPFPDPCLRVL